MKVFTLTASENWFPDRYATEYSKYSRHEGNVDDPYNSDAVWMIASYNWRSLDINFLKQTPTICSVHHIVPEKFNQHEFSERDKVVDLYHVPCKKTYNQVKDFTNKPIKIIGYWLNTDNWFPLDRQKCKQKLNLSNNNFYIGSFQRDTEGSDLKSPKLEKGPDRFCNYVEKINKEKKVHVLLNGWRRQYVINRLESSNIPFTYIEMPKLEVLRDMYGACDLYVVGARYEGGPQSLLEASATKTPIISTDVGMANDLLCKNCIIDTEKEIYFPTREDIEENFNKTQKYKISDQIKLYDDLIETTYFNFT